MDLQEVMRQKKFVVVGNTIDTDKYAYKIKEGLLEKNYEVQSVGKELNSINEVDGDIDVIDLCINPHKGLKLLKECKKEFKTIVIQPGAESNEIFDYLKENKLPYVESCLLVGLRLYAKK